jgi:hypothetical protein
VKGIERKFIKWQGYPLGRKRFRHLPQTDTLGLNRRKNWGQKEVCTITEQSQSQVCSRGQRWLEAVWQLLVSGLAGGLCLLSWSFLDSKRLKSDCRRDWLRAKDADTKWRWGAKLFSCLQLIPWPNKESVLLSKSGL